MMAYPALITKQKGLGIVMAMFILVVLGLLGAYMTRFAGVQTATTTYALQGARAYQAAKSGLGWAVARISPPANGTCANVTAQATLTFPNLPGFIVSLGCTSATYQEGATTSTVFRLNALSEFGVYGSADYVSRQIEATIVR